MKLRNSKSKKFKEILDDSESEETEETTESDISEESEVLKVAAKKKVVKSDTEEEKNKEIEEGKKSESHETNSSSGDESGWEEIGIGSGEEINIQTSVTKTGKKDEDRTFVKIASNIEGNSYQEKEDVNNTSEVKEISEDNDGNSFDIVNEELRKIDSDGTVEEELISDTVGTPSKKKRGRNPKETQADCPTATPKKRGRKPKTKTDLTEAAVEDLSLKKKRGRKKKCEDETIPESIIEDTMKQVHQETKVEVDVLGEKMGIMSDGKKETEESSEVLKSQDNSSTEKNECPPKHEKSKDDSPLSARNKQNAPVGIVKPEVRQGVIVENKQVIEGRMNESRTSEPSSVNPLQGMRDLAMGSQPMHGGHESSFTPFSQASYSSPNMQGYLPHQGFHNYHPSPSYGPQSPPGPSPYAGHQGIPSEGPHPRPQYHQNQSSVSPNSFQHSGSYLSQMQQGPQSYYPGNFRPQMGSRPDGFNSTNSQGSQSTNFHSQFPPNYPHQGTYHGPLRHGYPEHHGPYAVGPQGSMPAQHGAYHSSMPYSMQSTPRHGFWPQGGPQGPSTGSQPVRPQSRPSLSQPQGVSPSSRGEGAIETPNRGFMMDNILKPAPEGGSNDVEDSAEVSDIDRYTSFLCKTE